MKKVLIYNHCEKIIATKPAKSNYPLKKFEHTFPQSMGEVRIYGLPNGDILLQHENKERLWNYFDVSDDN